MVVIGALCVAAVTLAGAKIRCVDAAYSAARAAARGEPAAAVQQAATAVGPPGTRVSVVRSGDTIDVTVTVEVAPLPALLPRIGLTAHAEAAAEPDSVGGVDG